MKTFEQFLKEVDNPDRILYKLTKDKIRNEYKDADGYWINLNPGWLSEYDTKTIHERNKKEAYQVRVYYDNQGYV